MRIAISSRRTEPQILDMNGRRLGISICEDVWNDRDFWQRRRYHRDPIETLAERGAEAIVNLSASPFTAGKQAHARRDAGPHGAQVRPAVGLRQPGGRQRRSDLRRPQRRLRCAGRIVRARQRVSKRTCWWRTWRREPGAIAADDFEPEAEIWRALVLGVRDYARKTRFRKVLLGLSGGVDSALTAAMAADAMGAENVLGVMMPSVYSSAGSVNDSEALAATSASAPSRCPSPTSCETTRKPWRMRFRGLAADVTEENIQSRIRGNLLMALSNKFGSCCSPPAISREMSVGYCTLYGDMNGGLAVIADLPKMMVYRVSRWRNRRRPDIPEAILTKAPSAELRPDQTDQDSLPPYEVLDEILERHVEQCQSAEEIIAEGFDAATVRRVLRLVRIAEFKRKQAAPVLKVTSRAFGTGWRMPIVRQEYGGIEIHENIDYWFGKAGLRPWRP